jgi:hypothetical protein
MKHDEEVEVETWATCFGLVALTTVSLHWRCVFLQWSVRNCNAKLNPIPLDSMIPAIEYTLEQFAQRFLSKCMIDATKITASAEIRAKSVREKKAPPSCTLLELLLNDVPLGATSCLVFETTELEKNCGRTYPTPTRDYLQYYRELKSRQAVFKHIGGAKCIFMHMYVSPEDAVELLGEGTLAQLADVQNHVCL